MTSQPDLKPRPALREPAFRRYEAQMRAAVKEPLTLAPAQLDGRTARSWIVAFNEARCGLMRYGYSTDLDLVKVGWLEARETAEGGVYLAVRERRTDRIKTAIQTALEAPTPAAVLVDVLEWPAQRGRIEELLAQIKEDPGFLARHGEITIHTSSQAELETVELYCANAGVLYPLVDSKRRLVIVPIL